MYAILIVLIAATASSEIHECSKTFPKEIRPLWECCKMELNPGADFPSEQQQAISEYCYKNVNNSELDPGTTSGKYGCVAECIYIKLGLMGEDKTLHKENIIKEMNDVLHEDFHEASTKAVDTCMGKKYKTTKCPTGIDGMMLCIWIQLNLECPAQHWTNGEECNATRKYFEKCGATLYEDPDN